MNDRDPSSRFSAVAFLLLAVGAFEGDAVAQSREPRTSRGGPSAPVLVTAIPNDYQEPPGGWGPQCSRDRTRCAYLARRNSAAVVVVDGKPGPVYDEVRDVVFSDDGSHVAYRARRGASWMVVVDGREGVPFESIASLIFAGDVVVYVGDRDPGLDATTPSAALQRQRRRRLVFGEQISDGFQAVGDFAISPDSKQYAYVGREMGDPGQSRPGYSVCPPLTAMLFVNGESVTSDSVISSVSFTRDGRPVYVSRLGCVARGRSRVMVGDEEISRNTENVTAVAISPNGRHNAIAACTGAEAESRCVLSLDGKSLRESQSFEHLTFGPDGTMLAYAERQSADQWRMVVGTHTGPLVEGISNAVLFSPDGRRHAYAVTVGGRAAVVIDGVAGPAFDQVRGLVFSEDSTHVGYAALTDRKHHAVIDHVAGPAFTWISTPLFSAAGNELLFVGQEGRQFLRRSFAPVR
jgi:hypothetical protein